MSMALVTQPKHHGPIALTGTPQPVGSALSGALRPDPRGSPCVTTSVGGDAVRAVRLEEESELRRHRLGAGLGRARAADDPGLAFFYGGMVRAKHTLGMLMQNFAAIAVVSVTWVLDRLHLGVRRGRASSSATCTSVGMQHINDVVPTLGTAQTIPTMVFVAFQLTFAIITPALITGSTADRWKFGAFVAFVAVWSIVIYAPVAHWVFDGYGWLNQSLIEPAGNFFAEDFAGGTVVHINAGAAGLAMALVLGKRRGWPREKMRGHNIPFVHARRRPAVVRLVRVQRRLGADRGQPRRPTPGSTPTPRRRPRCSAGSSRRSCATGSRRRSAPRPVRSPAWSRSPRAPAGSARSGRSSSVFIAGFVCAFAISLKNKFGFDDSLDVVGVHFVGGWIGTLCIGFFSTTGTNSLGNNGILYGGGGKYGGWNLLLHQFLAAGAVTIFSFVGTLHHRQGDRAVHQDPGQRGRGARGPRHSRSTASPPTTSARSVGSVRATTCPRRRDVRRGWTHEAGHRGHQAVQAR